MKHMCRKGKRIGLKTWEAKDPCKKIPVRLRELLCPFLAFSFGKGFCLAGRNHMPKC